MINGIRMEPLWGLRLWIADVHLPGDVPGEHDAGKMGSLLPADSGAAGGQFLPSLML
jgi:hypothetical protein